jgi:glutaconate CoA-transferase, subunit A
VISRDSRRVSKVASINDAISVVQPGSLVAVGGVLTENKPLALERALVRQGTTGLRLIALSASGYDADLLIAYGVVAETLIPAITFDSVGLAPSFRAAVEGGALVAHPVDVTSVMAGYMASAEGISFHPVEALRGSDLTAINPLVREFRSPIDDTTIWAVAAIEPDVALIHAQEADRFGNARILGPSAYGENLIARASKHVILSCDRLIEPEEIRGDPLRTSIPGMYVNTVVEVRYGAHPTSSPGRYDADRDHIRDYWQRAETARRTGNMSALTEYRETYVVGPADHDDYISRVGDPRLRKLAEVLG